MFQTLLLLFLFLAPIFGHVNMVSVEEPAAAVPAGLVKRHNNFHESSCCGTNCCGCTGGGFDGPCFNLVCSASMVCDYLTSCGGLNYYHPRLSNTCFRGVYVYVHFKAVGYDCDKWVDRGPYDFSGNEANFIDVASRNRYFYWRAVDSNGNRVNRNDKSLDGEMWQEEYFPALNSHDQSVTISLPCAVATPAPTPSMCSSATSCSGCTRTSGCGWCAARGRCEPGTPTAGADGYCNDNDNDWFWLSSECAVATSSPPPPFMPSPTRRPYTPSPTWPSPPPSPTTRPYTPSPTWPSPPPPPFMPSPTRRPYTPSPTWPSPPSPTRGSITPSPTTSGFRRLISRSVSLDDHYSLPCEFYRNSPATMTCDWEPVAKFYASSTRASWPSRMLDIRTAVHYTAPVDSRSLAVVDDDAVLGADNKKNQELFDTHIMYSQEAINSHGNGVCVDKREYSWFDGGDCICSVACQADDGESTWDSTNECHCPSCGGRSGLDLHRHCQSQTGGTGSCDRCCNFPRYNYDQGRCCDENNDSRWRQCRSSSFWAFPDCCVDPRVRKHRSIIQFRELVFASENPVDTLLIVVTPLSAAGLLGQATFPFPGIPGFRTRQGGFICSPTGFADEYTLEHELGHCLGLFHTFMGNCIDQSTCTDCCPTANGRNWTNGDHVADTVSEYRNWDCTVDSEVPDCDGNNFINMPGRNLMSYGDCVSSTETNVLTPGQIARLRCVTELRLPERVQSQSNRIPGPLKVWVRLKNYVMNVWFLKPFDGRLNPNLFITLTGSLKSNLFEYRVTLSGRERSIDAPVLLHQVSFPLSDFMDSGSISSLSPTDKLSLTVFGSFTEGAPGYKENYSIHMSFLQSKRSDSTACAPDCLLEMRGDGLCDQECNVSACGMDDGDCVGGGLSSEYMKECFLSGCSADLLYNDECDPACNSRVCQFDNSFCFPYDLNALGAALAHRSPTTDDDSDHCQCSQHGVCVLGLCLCSVGYTGESCEELDRHTVFDSDGSVLPAFNTWQLDSDGVPLFPTDQTDAGRPKTLPEPVQKRLHEFNELGIREWTSPSPSSRPSPSSSLLFGFISEQALMIIATAAGTLLLLAICCGCTACLVRRSRRSNQRNSPVPLTSITAQSPGRSRRSRQTSVRTKPKSSSLTSSNSSIGDSSSGSRRSRQSSIRNPVVSNVSARQGRFPDSAPPMPPPSYHSLVSQLPPSPGPIPATPTITNNNDAGRHAGRRGKLAFPGYMGLQDV